MKSRSAAAEVCFLVCRSHTGALAIVPRAGPPCPLGGVEPDVEHAAPLYSSHRRPPNRLTNASALANVLSPGDALLVLMNGQFSERFALIGKGMGASVDRLEVPWGEAPDPADVAYSDQGAPDQPAKIAHRELVSADSRPPVSRFEFAVGTRTMPPLLFRRGPRLCAKIRDLHGSYARCLRLVGTRTRTLQ
jgi:hypothetical protein